MLVASFAHAWIKRINGYERFECLAIKLLQLNSDEANIIVGIF